MPKGNTATTEAPAKKQRTILTPAQRIEKLKAEAEALEKREQDRAKSKIATAEQKVTDLQAKRDKLNDQIQVALLELDELRLIAGVITEDSQPES